MAQVCERRRGSISNRMASEDSLTPCRARNVLITSDARLSEGKDTLDLAIVEQRYCEDVTPAIS